MPMNESQVIAIWRRDQNDPKLVGCRPAGFDQGNAMEEVDDADERFDLPLSPVQTEPLVHRFDHSNRPANGTGAVTTS
jgi:hypothetical protein